MKTKGKILGRVWRIFKFSGPVDCQETQISSGNTQANTNIFPGTASDAHNNHHDENLENNLHSIKIQKKAELGTTFLRRRFALYKPKKYKQISPVRSQAELSYEIDLDDDGLSNFLAFRYSSSAQSSNYSTSTSPHPCRTVSQSPETLVISPLEVNPLTLDRGEEVLSFQYSVATSKIPLELLFKQTHFRTNKSLWNSLLVPCDTSRRSVDPRFNVQILVTLPSGHLTSVDQAMQVGVFYCHRSTITLQSSYFQALLSSEAGEERQESGTTGLDIITFTTPPFSVETLKIALDFIYNIPEKDLLRLDLQSACRDLTCSEPFFLYKTARVLGLSSLMKRVSSELIIEKMLHRIPSDILTDSMEHSQSLRGNWTNPNDQAVCRCSTCAHFAPRVLSFSLENEVKDVLLEHAARQTLIESFGIGWCTSEFATLPQEITESISDDLLAVITPQNSLSILFATEEALSALDHSPLPSSSTRRVLSKAQTAIEDLISEDPGGCFDSPEWMELSNPSNLQVETSPDNVVKLRWISDVINRIRQNGCPWSDSLDYLDRLRHLVAELRLTSTPQHSSPSSHISEDRVFQFVNSPVVSLSYPHGRFSSIIFPVAHEASPPTTHLIPSSLYSTTQGSVESLPYSHASSRTASTDYGLFYTRLGLSPPSSVLERPISPPTILMTPRMPQPRIYQRSPLGIFPSISPDNSLDLSGPPYPLSLQPPISFRIDSPPPVPSSSSKAGLAGISSDSQSSETSMEQPPAYALVERQDNLRENQAYHPENNASTPIRSAEPAMVNTQVEDQGLLEQKILELQSASARLQEALVKHDSELKEAVDRLKAYQERTNITNGSEHAQDISANQNRTSPEHDLAPQQTATGDTEEASIQEDVFLARPYEVLENTMESGISGNPEGRQGFEQRVNSSEPAHSGTGTTEFTENVEIFNLQQGTMEVRIVCKPQTQLDQHQRGSSQSSRAVTLNKVCEELEGTGKNSRYLEHPPETGTREREPGHSVNSGDVEVNPHVDQSFFENQEEGISKELDQLDEYLARFEDRLTLYKSTCEERLISRPKGKGSGAIVCGYSRQELLQQKELVDKLDSVIWKIKEGRKNLSEVSRQIRDDYTTYTTSKKREHTENPWQAEDQMKYLEHVLVSLIKRRSTKRRSPRLTKWRDDGVYLTRKRSERKWRNKCAVDKW